MSRLERYQAIVEKRGEPKPPEFITTLIICPKIIDANEHVNNAAYLRLYQDGGLN